MSDKISNVSIDEESSIINKFGDSRCEPANAFANLGKGDAPNEAIPGVPDSEGARVAVLPDTDRSRREPDLE